MWENKTFGILPKEKRAVEYSVNVNRMVRAIEKDEK